MNNFSFLDSGPQPPLPRAAPSPSPSPTSTQANGMPGPGPQQNGIPMVNGLPSGGQQTDMNHLWSVVQQLSQMLEENRAQTAGIVNGVQAIQARAADEGGVGSLAIREVNGEISCMLRLQYIRTRMYSARANTQSQQQPARPKLRNCRTLSTPPSLG
jgi:hypothetical protein